MDHQISKEQKGNSGTFYVEIEGERKAVLNFSIEENNFIIDHTSVEDELRGTGTGKALVASAASEARKLGYKLIPFCTFAKSVLDRQEN